MISVNSIILIFAELKFIVYHERYGKHLLRQNNFFIIDICAIFISYNLRAGYSVDDICIITQLVLDAKRFILIPWLSFSITVLCAFQKAKNINDRLQKKAFAYTIFAQYQCCVVAT